MTPETQPPHYETPPEPGTPVLVWPKAEVGKDPMVGLVLKGHHTGLADIAVLPYSDGAVMTHDSVFHIGDKRLFDVRGNITSAGHNKGCWEFAPHVKGFYEGDEVDDQEPAPKRAARKTDKKS